MPEVSAHYTLQKTFYFAFSWPVTYMTFSFLSLSYCAFNNLSKPKGKVYYCIKSFWPVIISHHRT